MGNPQHLEWLLEGVEAWNERRETDGFRPDFSNVNISTAFENVGKFRENRQLNLPKMNPTETDLSEVNFFEADLCSADLTGVKMVGADLIRADMRRSNLTGANLRRSDLRGADFRKSDLREANLNLANIRSPNNLSERDFEKLTIVTDFRGSFNLTQRQLESMIGDTGVILPDGLHYPKHWPEWQPTLPNTIQTPAKQSTGDHVSFTNGTFSLTHNPTPAREILETLYDDLKDDIKTLKNSGSFDNISKAFETALNKYLKLAEVPYSDLNQIMLGVKGNQLQLIFDAERKAISEIAPEKTGYVDAILMAHGLLAARMPDWQEFLDETRDDVKTTEAHSDTLLRELEKVKTDAADHPEIFDPELPETLGEYLANDTPDGLLAARNIVLNIMHATFTELKSLGKDGYKMARPVLVAGIAGVLIGVTGATALELAALYPQTAGWIANGFDEALQLLKRIKGGTK